MAVCRMVCFLYGIVFIIHLYYPFHFTKAQGLSPTLTVSSYIISERDSVDLSCVLYRSPPLSDCIFSLVDKKANTHRASSCQLSLTGEKLRRWSGLVTLPAIVRMNCSTADKPSQQSQSVSVIVKGFSPTLTVSSDIISERDTVILNCTDSRSPPLSDCIFSLVDTKKNTYKAPSCQLSLTGEELRRWSGLATLPAIVRMNCYTADKPSHPVSITVKTPAPPPPKPNLKISPAVLRESSTVQMTCEVPQSQSASLCLFYLDGIEAAPYSHPSCQMSLTGVQIQQWTRQSSPLEAKVGCYYLTEGARTPSDHSDYVSLTVLDRLQKPNIKVLHDGSISIVCHIPKHFGEATDCQLYTGDEHQSYLKTKTSKSASGVLACQFTVNKDDLFRRLQSVRSRGVSCDYTVNTEPPSLSPRSDPYNFTAATITAATTACGTKTIGLSSTTTSTLKSTRKILTTTIYPSSSGPAVLTSTSLRDYSTHLHSNQAAKDSFTFGPWLPVSAVVLVVGLFLGVLTAGCLSPKRHKHTRSQNATNWRSDAVRFGPNNIKMDKGGDRSLLAILETSGSDLKKDSEEDVSNPYHVYSTIPDTLDVSTQQGPTYSLAQAGRDPHTTQQGPTYSLAQAGRDPHTTQQNPTYSLAQAGRDPHHPAGHGL
ncbi:uncharacterized protein LOC121707830 isoform X2 [Alosa sapidissima]|uniref:uncharacterized protein LOC121707830 isoform X2 n=1 Tax=Alosa sapidissima TaxID=34773 RepID=UPI001C09A750|nr:uncharacterized protein LOC121707830 isoform X2 [Alosa sapidissima]